MEPAFLKDIHPNREALRIRHGKQSRKVPSIHLRHLPGPPVLPRLCLPTVLKTPSPSSPPARPDPAGESLPLPTLPPPSQPSLRRSSGPSPWRLQTRGSQTSWLRGEALPGAASRGSHPAGSGDSPPPETAEKLGQECQTRPLSASSATPRRLPSELSPRNCYLPSALPDLERESEGGAAQCSSARGPALRTHLPSAPPSAPPDAAPSWGMKAPPSRPGRPRQGREENLLRRPLPPPPPPRPALRLRRLTGQVSRGAACSKRVTAGSASLRGTAALGRVAVPVAERLGAACGTAAPTAHGHVFVPFFFLFCPSFRPFPRNSTFLPPVPLPFLLRGWVENGVGEGWGRAGAGQCSSSAPRRGRGRAAAAYPPPSRPLRDPREARGLSLRALPLRPRIESQAKTELWRKGPGRCFAPLPAVFKLAVWCGFIALASGRWRLLLLFQSRGE